VKFVEDREEKKSRVENTHTCRLKKLFRAIIEGSLRKEVWIFICVFIFA